MDRIHTAQSRKGRKGEGEGRGKGEGEGREGGGEGGKGVLRCPGPRWSGDGLELVCEASVSGATKQMGRERWLTIVDIVRYNWINLYSFPFVNYGCDTSNSGINKRLHFEFCCRFHSLTWELDIWWMLMLCFICFAWSAVFFCSCRFCYARIYVAAEQSIWLFFCRQTIFYFFQNK